MEAIRSGFPAYSPERCSCSRLLQFIGQQSAGCVTLKRSGKGYGVILNEASPAVGHHAPLGKPLTGTRLNRPPPGCRIKCRFTSAKQKSLGIIIRYIDYYNF